MKEDLERCDREIAEALTHSEAPAWLVSMGVNDWTVERDLIVLQSSGLSASQAPIDFGSALRIP